MALARSRGTRLMTALRRAVVLAGLLTLAGMCWLAAGGRTGLDQWLDVTEPAAPAAAIVVLGGGIGMGNLPLPQGWERLITAARLYTDGLAPVVVLTGAAGTTVSEAEVYAYAAEWLGIPRQAMVLEATAGSTAEHGAALLGMTLPTGRVVSTETPLLVVTSAVHSRRALMAFAHTGFSRVRIVSHHVPARPAPAGSPEALVGAVPGFTSSGKRYDDVLLRLAYGSFDFFLQARETGAILVSRIRQR